MLWWIWWKTCIKVVMKKWKEPLPKLGNLVKRKKNLKNYEFANIQFINIYVLKQILSKKINHFIYTRLIKLFMNTLIHLRPLWEDFIWDWNCLKKIFWSSKELLFSDIAKIYENVWSNIKIIYYSVSLSRGN